MARRTVMQRVALERGLLRIPLLCQALREGRITYEKARLIARHWESGHAREVRPLIAMAQTITCVEFREALTAKTEGQMCAQAGFTVTGPPDIFDLLKDTLRMARALAGRSISLGMCLVEMATHFVAVWKAHLKARMTKRMRIFGRDGHRCQVPGCSRPAVHLHHLEYRSHGGSDEDSNLLCLCRSPPLRHPGRADAGHRDGARQAGLGIRPAPQLGRDGGPVTREDATWAARESAAVSPPAESRLEPEWRQESRRALRSRAAAAPAL
jgi:hypothetical protein